MKPIRGLCTAIVILESLAVLGATGVLVTQVAVAGSAEDFQEGVLTASEFDEELAPFLGVALLAGLVGIAGLVLLIIWSYRIATNLQQTDSRLTWKPGLSILAWLVGGCTLNILPFLMLREHWYESHPARTRQSEYETRGPLNPLIPVWFGLSLASTVVNAVASGVASLSGFNVGRGRRDLAESLADSFPLTVAATALSIAAFVVLIIVVRQLTARHVVYSGEE